MTVVLPCERWTPRRSQADEDIVVGLGDAGASVVGGAVSGAATGTGTSS